jgi:hypothetical protein
MILQFTDGHRLGWRNVRRKQKQDQHHKLAETPI